VSAGPLAVEHADREAGVRPPEPSPAPLCNRECVLGGTCIVIAGESLLVAAHISTVRVQHGDIETFDSSDAAFDALERSACCHEVMMPESSLACVHERKARSSHQVV
jgi:hypothetical protein